MDNNPQAQPGTLYLVATPIGDPLDIGLRALELLSRVDCLAAEDTRLARRLLAAHRISRRVLSYHEHNARRQKLVLLAQLEQGHDVALISDAGTPLISDPGWGLVQLAISRQISIRSVPGPCALISALISSGLPCHEFHFSGFVPRKASQRARLWQKLRGRSVTTVTYLPAHLVVRVLDELIQYLPDRPVVLHKEITKSYENIWRDLPAAVADRIRSAPALAKGEFVLLIKGADSGDND